jgi:ribosomal subunit interface protein
MIPFQISFRHSSGLPMISALIEERIQKLEHFFDRVEYCRVVISSPRRNRRDAIHHVNIHLSIPGDDIIINREPEKNIEHRDLALAIRDAFDSAERQLEDRVRLRREKNRRLKFRRSTEQEYAWLDRAN